MDRFTSAAIGATDLLREDHQRVKELFSRFDETDEMTTKAEIVEQTLLELTIHTALEEEIFYPAVRTQDDSDSTVDQAEEEHHVAKILIAELETMDPGDPRFDAKFRVLSEAVRHHIQEEELNMLPEAERSGLDMAVLGARMMERREMLEGHPADVMALSRGSKRAARRKTSKVRAHAH